MTEQERFYTPADEPYGQLEVVRRFDEALISAWDVCNVLSPLMRGAHLTVIEAAVIDLVPTSISIAASIRELVRQAYLTGAKILLRPLIERTAVVDYIVNQPDGPDLWARGWERGKRPHLRTLLTLMSGQDGADDEIIKSIIDDFHSVVHAEPAGSCKFLAPSPDGTLAYSARRMLHSDDMMTEISSASAMALIFLQSNAQRAFRDRVVSYAKELENEAQKGRH